MSFFDKFFSHRNRTSKNESLRSETAPLRVHKPNVPPKIWITSFRSVQLNISKDQIRFILFRECDRRGRKLLFDSNAVEKLPLPSREIMCNQKSQRHNERIVDFIDTTKTHGYKYKKPSSDVAYLGEMVFGSVAVVYKGENSCKIHSIPSPRRLMFTTIVHAHSRCSANTTSELNLNGSKESSLPSISELMTQETSSSDSKLYRRETVAQKYSSTYPWIKHNFPSNKLIQCCEISDIDSSPKRPLAHVPSEITSLEKLCLTKENSESNVNNLTQQKGGLGKICSEGDWSCGSNACLAQKDTEGDLSSVYDSSNITSNESENFSSVSGSLSSLRRRWAQSYSTSLDSTNYESTSSSPSKRRTKLGMALVLDLSNTLEEKLEKFLFNHTLVIDSIMRKLQSSVELAYARNENFVHLIYTAFLDSQQTIHELITGGKYQMPIWCSLVGDFDRGLENFLPQIHPQRESARLCKNHELLNSVQVKFLNEFYEVLVKFDTKDTNFFISTLLTAVLTHHLSWVTSIAETDSSATDENLTVIKSVRPYNPIWAQLNDLSGLLGSPLKSAKTVITGDENRKNQMAAIIQVLTYFIRCYNVVENVYEVDVEDILGNAEKNKSEEENFDSDFESDGCVSSATSNFENKINFRGKSHPEEKELSVQENNCKTESEGGLKRNKNHLSDLKMENNTVKLYPDIKDMARSENVNVADLNHEEKTSDNIFCGEKLTKKIQKLIRVPSTSIKPNLEEYLSPDEGYDTIDSTKTDNFNDKKVVMEKQCSAPKSRKKNIVFVLGENEELVNLDKKIVVNKSSLIEMEKEEVNKPVQIVSECVLLSECENPKKIQEGSWTSEKLSKKLWLNIDDEKTVEHSTSEDCSKNNCSLKMPWMIREINVPRTIKPCQSRQLEVSSVLGGVNKHYNSEQVIQGVLDPKNVWEHTLLKDLYLSSHIPILEKDVSEALCIVGDMNSWEVSVFSSSTSTLDRSKQSGVRVGMSQLVADMLESFLYLHTISLSPSFCLVHIERKLHEIYLKSKTVAELLNSTDVCTIDYLTAKLDIGISDVPLLLSVATTHSPHISEKYGLSFT